MIALGDRLHESVSGMEYVLEMFNWNHQAQPYEYWAALWNNVVIGSKPPSQIKLPIIYSKVPEPSISVNDPWYTVGTVAGCSTATEKASDQQLPVPKKIIGYKTPYDLFQGRIKKGSIFINYSPYKLVMYTKEFTTRGVATEIVKTWEPVYQENVVLNVGSPNLNVTITTDGKIEAKGQQISPKDFKEIWESMTGQRKLNTWPIHHHEVTIGCSRFTNVEINKIWVNFQQLNPKFSI